MATKYNGTQEEVEAFSTVITLMRCYNTVMANVKESFGDFTESQFGVLELLFHLGPQSQNKIAKKILKSNSNIVTIIDNLEKYGLVIREKSLTDRRSILVSLTPLGKDKIEAQLKVHAKKLVEEFSVLNSEEKKEFQFLCKKLGKVI